MNEILTETIGPILRLTLNRPEKRNALNDTLIAALKDALRDADANEELRAIVIRGAGKDFCSGADLEALRKISDASYEEKSQPECHPNRLSDVPRTTHRDVDAHRRFP